MRVKESEQEKEKEGEPEAFLSLLRSILCCIMGVSVLHWKQDQLIAYMHRWPDYVTILLLSLVLSII